MNKPITNYFKSPRLFFYIVFLSELSVIFSTLGYLPILSVIISLLSFIIINIIFFVNSYHSKRKLTSFIVFGIYYLVFFLVLMYHKSSFEYFFSLSNLIVGTSLILNFKNYQTRNIKLYFFSFIILFILKVFFTPLGDAKLILAENNLNPNSMGLFLFVFYCIFIVDFSYTKKKRKLFLALVLVILQEFYMCRSSILFSILFTLSVFISNYFNIKFKHKGLIITIILVLQLYFTYFYSIILYESIGKNNIIMFGKDIFTGREVIWSDAFKQIGGNLFLGIGNTFTSTLNINGEYMTNLHNSALAILLNFGAVGLISTIIICGHLFFKKKYKFSFLFFCSILGLSFFETHLLSTGSVFSILLGLLYIHEIEMRYVKDENS